MNRHRNSTTAAGLMFAVASLFAFALASSAPESASTAKARPNAAWESLKSLQGEWTGLFEGKLATRASYRLVSNGTVLMETLVSPHSEDMVTMYHPDGNDLVMTHYCSAGNQSRMRAKPGPDPGRIAFTLMDATNMAAAESHLMSGLVVTRKDANHFAQSWTNSGGGKSETTVFEFTRQK